MSQSIDKSAMNFLPPPLSPPNEPPLSGSGEQNASFIINLIFIFCF